MSKAGSGLFPRRESRDELIQQLKDQGAKFNEKEIVFITRDQSGQIVWLEKGSPSAGLEHILNGNGKKPGHAADFKNAFGLDKDQVAGHLENVMSYGLVVSNKLKTINGRQGYERIYYYGGKHYVLAGIGTNGFVVSAYPIDLEE